MRRIPVNRFLIFALLTAGALVADLYAKSVIFADLGYPGAEPVASRLGEHERFAAPAGHEGESVLYIDGWMTFRLLTSFNRGALWGLGQEYTWLFASLSLAAVVGIPVWLFGFYAARSLWLTIALGFILGGTLGNLYDRMGLHRCVDIDGTTIRAVRDFLLFTFGGFHWPVFNLADVFLVTGALMLVAHSLLPIQSAAAAVEGVSASHAFASQPVANQAGTSQTDVSPVATNPPTSEPAALLPRQPQAR